MYLRNLFIFLGLVNISYAKLTNQEKLYRHLFELKINESESDSGSGDESGEWEDYYYEENDELVDGVYDNRVRPIFDFNNYVNTTFSVKINSLEFFKQPEEKIKFNVELDLYWNDEFLRWKPRKFENVTSINVNPDNIWIPDIELYNSGDFPELWTKDLEATLDFRGNVYLPIPVLLTFSCNLELENFPFDRQSCSMEFGSWKFSKRYLDVRVINETLTRRSVVDYEGFYHNEWNIIDAYGITEDLEYLCCPGEIFPTSTLTIELERKYTKYNIVIIMTVFLTLSSLNVLLLSMEKYRRTFILVFIPLTIIWVQLYIASKIPVIEYSTKMENLLMSCYYTCMICALYSGLIFCFLNNEIRLLRALGIKVNIEKTYFWKPDKVKLTFKSSQNETVAKKYLDLRQKVKLVDNVIKTILFFSFFISVIVFTT
jgi:hypothetical protein